MSIDDKAGNATLAPVIPFPQQKPQWARRPFKDWAYFFFGDVVLPSSVIGIAAGFFAAKSGFGYESMIAAPAIGMLAAAFFYDVNKQTINYAKNVPAYNLSAKSLEEYWARCAQSEALLQYPVPRKA